MAKQTDDKKKAPAKPAPGGKGGTTAPKSGDMKGGQKGGAQKGGDKGGAKKGGKK